MVLPGSVPHIISVNCFKRKSKGCSVEIDNGLLEKYRVLLSENSALLEKNEILKARLGISPSPDPLQDPKSPMMTDHARRESVQRYASVQLGEKRILLEGIRSCAFFLWLPSINLVEPGCRV
jgi:hypothetical protein